MGHIKPYYRVINLIFLSFEFYLNFFLIQLVEWLNVIVVVLCPTQDSKLITAYLFQSHLRGENR